MENFNEVKINPQNDQCTTKCRSTDTSKITLYPCPDTPSDQTKSPFILSTSQIEPSPNMRSRSYKRKSISNLEIVKNISDLNDKMQIQQAINSAETVRDRVQIVDIVLKKRNELKEASDQEKLKKAAPLLQNLSLNFRNRMKKMKERQGKSNFLKSLLSDNSMGDHSPLINKENSPERCANSSQVETNEKLDTKKKPGFNLLLQPDYILDSFNSPTNRSSQTEANNHSQVKSKASLKHSNVSAPSSPTSSNSNNFAVSRKARNKLNFSLGKALSPKGIHDSMNSQSERGKSLDPPEKKINLRPKYRKEIEIKNSKKFAKGEIEKDLYKYLLKYKNEKEYQGLVLQTSDTKIKKIKSIEEKAKEKFDVFLKTKKSFLQDPNEDQAENLESPTTMKKFKKSQLYRSVGLFQDNVKIRKPYFIMQDKPPKPEPPNPFLRVDQDSLASLTETQLGSLYQNTQQINENLNIIQKKLEKVKSQKSWKELLKLRMDKLKDLHLNSEEIMKVINNKLI